MTQPGARFGLPLPVARLAVRSRNAKSSKDRHDTAWYAWEVSIKLAVAAAPPADVARLARGTIGTWRAALRPVEKPLTEPALQKLFELLAKEGEVAKAQRSMPTPAAFLDALVAYRNRVVGHGALREPAFYEQAAEKLLAALEPAWHAELFLPREAQLLYCEAIVLGADGSRLGRILDLSGPDALVDDPRGSAVPPTLLPRRLYLRFPTGWRDLHPWLVYREGDSREREALYCFNGLGPTLAEYLDYASGETLRNEALEADWPGIVGELRKLFPSTTTHEADAPRSKDLHRLGDYAILGKLGQGGMGEVYLARQEPLGRLVALKTLSRERAQDQVAAARFRQEMKALARSEHPSVVKILGSGESDGVWYYAMEYVVGADLERVARALSTSDDFERAVTSVCEAVQEERKELFGDVPVVRQPRVEQQKGVRRYKDLARFFRDAARGLHHLHEKGVLHRDVKPSNLMVTAAGHRAVVMDLGVAAVEGSTISVAHDRSRIVGTLRYIAPEQLQRSLVEVDRRADVYSLGASLYELLCDRPFFDGDTEARLIQQVLKEEPRSIERGVPEDLARIVRKATDKDPAQRYETAEALAQDLENYLAGMPVSARDPELGYLIRKWVERNRALALASAAGVLVLASTVTFFSLWLAAKNEALRGKTVEAETSAKLANAKTAEVLRLSAFQRLVDLEAEADRLWPAEPQKLPEYERWLERAHELVAGLDPHGDDPGHRAQLAKLRERATPLTEDEREAKRRAHPRFGELGPLETKVAALQAAQNVREGKAQPAAFAFDASKLLSDADGMNGLARPLVDPARTEFGREAEGLALARLAIEKVEDDESAARAGNTLAWALFANGLDEEALKESAAALDAAPAGRRSEYEAQGVKLRKEVEAARSGSPLSTAESELSALQTEISATEDYHFTDEQDTWWHNQLQKLVGEIEVFGDPNTGVIAGISPEHGWGIERRRDFATTITERSIDGEEAQRLWSTAIASIADPKECPKYGGLRISPQLGLLPIGRDPDSGLWEFADLQTGVAPRRSTDGKLVLTEGMGLVFVLLPGGTFTMGAQSKNPSGPNYDPQAGTNETPHSVTLSAFLLSKYEMTQGQWFWFTGRSPSNFGPHNYDHSLNRAGGGADLLHPVEQVTWTTCAETCGKLGLILPSEAQWEYGTRAGTETPWWTGTDPKELATAGNLADSWALAHGATADWNCEAWDDGNTVHAAVGSYRANPFGLHDVIGNVWEWCEDKSGSSSRAYRGGSFLYGAVLARSAFRSSPPREYAAFNLGLRPAKTIAP